MKHLTFLMLGLLLISCSDRNSSASNSGSSVQLPQTGIDKNVVSMESGEATYKKYCQACHGVKGDLGIGGAADLSISKLDSTASTLLLLEGRGAMVGYKNVLNAAQIESVRRFAATLIKE